MNPRIQTVLLLFFLAAIALTALGGGYLFWQGQQDSVPQVENLHQPRSRPTTPGSADGTDNWKRYANATMGFSLLYPPDKNLQVSGDQKDQVFIMAPQSDYGLVISQRPNPSELLPRQWLIYNFSSVYGGIQIGGKQLNVSDLTVTDSTLANQPAINASGPMLASSIFVIKPTRNYILEIRGDALGPELLRQILSSFRFL